MVNFKPVHICTQVIVNIYGIRRAHLHHLKPVHICKQVTVNMYGIRRAHLHYVQIKGKSNGISVKNVQEEQLGERYREKDGQQDKSLKFAVK